MLTDFGKVCRKLRIDNDEILANMSQKLGVAASLLSAVENGRKNVPDGWYEKIVNVYELSEVAASELQKAIEDSQRQIKIQLESLQSDDRKLVLSFARKFEQLNSESKRIICSILNEE